MTDRGGNTPSSEEFEAAYQAGYKAGVEAQFGLEQATALTESEFAYLSNYLDKQAAKWLANVSDRAAHSDIVRRDLYAGYVATIDRIKAKLAAHSGRSADEAES